MLLSSFDMLHPYPARGAAILRWALGVLLGLALAGCASLPAPVTRTETRALTGTDDTRLGREIRAEKSAHPGQSGIHALSNAEDAFAARILLARNAQRSLDLQYYIWHADTTGELMWEAVWQAAERGVRVRLLLDDVNTQGLDATLAALNAHPNIEVRLFNPFANRNFRVADFALDFSRVNRRMHNKSFTADNQVTIVGGRNIGDEYFGANMDVGFQDLDVIAIGPVVREVSDQFDLYWNSASAYPAASLLPPAPAGAAATLQERWARVHDDEQAQHYFEAVRRTPLVEAIDRSSVDYEWTTARVLHDDPAKVTESTDRRDLQMMPLLREALGKPRGEVDLVSPYFVPGKEGTRALAELARSGVDVRVLTNSLAATDVAPVHAGYSRYRRELLEAGVTLYELKPGIGVAPPVQADKDGKGGTEAARSRIPGSGGSQVSSAASLHAKTFEVDRERIFVGSFNFDPRSAHLNTEMGVIIDSPVLAGELARQFETRIPQASYRVRLTPEGAMEWIETGPQGEIRYTSEPGASALRRLYINFLGILPIEGLL
jgi:putative cardiolipin synthase